MKFSQVKKGVTNKVAKIMQISNNHMYFKMMGDVLISKEEIETVNNPTNPSGWRQLKIK